MQNFLYNAIDAIEEWDECEEGTREVVFREEGGYSCFYIYDSGAPIENKNILFEPFKSTKTKGHGLGLSLSMQIVKAHGGDIALLEGRKGFLIKIVNNPN